MRLERLRVDRYGPLAGVDLDLDPGLQLVHGPNESGKTLLVEALLALATGEQPAGARVDGEAVGRLTVAGTDDGGGHTVDGDTTLLDVYADVHGYAFTPAEFRNVFSIRDGDLAVEGDYYESVTQQVTGLRSEDIRRLMDRVREAGRLTPERLAVSSAAEHGHAGDQREAAADLRDAAGEYVETARADGRQALERDLLAARREVADLEAAVDALSAAVERERVADRRATVATLSSALAAREDLPPRGTVDGLRRDLDDLAHHGRNEDALARRLEFYRPVAGLALLVAVLGVAARLLADLGPLGVAVPVAGVLAAAVAAYRWGRTNRQLAAIERDRDALLGAARDAGLDPDGVEELRATVAELEERRDAVASDVDQAVGALRDALDLDASDPEAVRAAATEALDERAADLPAEADVDGPVTGERLAERQEALADRREALAAARDRVAERERALEEHAEALDRFDREARGIDFERFTGDAFDVEVTSLEALATLRDRCEAVVDAIEREAAVARTAHDVLGGMAADEGEKVAALFGPDSRASEVFELVTDGRYDAVGYDADADRLAVAGRGEALAPTALSQGARDQLFFAVRVGLAEQLLGGRQGTFVLDDAFVAADPDRLDRQVTVLERLVEAGWQVLYLTAKADAVERLAPLCATPVELDAL